MIGNKRASSDGLQSGEYDRFRIKRTRLIATNNTVNLNLPGTSGTLALITDVPGSGSFVDIASNQTIAGIKTFTDLAAPSISNGAVTVLMPTTSGTFALLSQIPTNSTYMDLTTPQTSVGKTFTSTVLGPNGSNTGVSFGCGTVLNGLYFNTTNNATCVADGTTATDVLYVVGTRSVQTLNRGVCVRVTGTAAAPSLRIQDNDSGWYSGGSGSWKYAVAGTDVVGLSSTGVAVSGNVAATGNISTSSQITAGHILTTGVDFVGATASKVLNFDVSGQTASTTTTLITTSTANRSITFPNFTTVLMSLSGLQTVLGQKIFTGGVQIGASGSFIGKVREGFVTVSTVITAGGNATLANVDISSTGFSGAPKVQVTVGTPLTGLNNWDRVLVAVDGSLTTSVNLCIIGVNLGSSSTSGTATLYFRCVE